jgi:hypothetical protein
MQPIQQILAARNLIGRIVDIVNGVPEDVLPKAFLTATRSVEGDRGEYLRVAGTRQTAPVQRYGSQAGHEEPAGIGSTPVKLLHTFREFRHDPTTLQLLISESGSQSMLRQQLGRETVQRQIDVFGAKLRNLRVSCVYSALAKGAICFDGQGNLLPAATGAALTIDFGVPAGNQGALDPFGTGTPLLSNWTVAKPYILRQLKAVKKAARKLTGYPITRAFYGENIPGYIASDPEAQSFIRGNPQIAAEAASGEIPSSVGKLTWIPIEQAFFVDQAGTAQDWFSPDTIVFTPDPDVGWWEFLEGTYPVPRSVQLSGDMLGALDHFEQVAGVFSFASVTINPPTLVHYAGDTFLPVLKNPKAIFIATVPTS